MVIGLIFLLIGAGWLFWLAYRRPRPRRWLLPRRIATAQAVAAVDRQHRHLHAGGLIGETTFELTKLRLQEQLAAGQTTEIEGGLRAGLDFAIRVRALAEIATPEAGLILERQLTRTHTRDPIEQAWYWVDVATALRKLNRTESLPAVLRCADSAAEFQQGPVLAAEAVAFANFPAVLHDLASATGQAAVRALSRAARGCRDGVIDPSTMVRVGLGDHLAAVCETASSVTDAGVTLVILEAQRIARRLGHWARLLPADVRPLAERQSARLAASASRRADWLASAAERLVASFPQAAPEARAEILVALGELRADVVRLFPVLPDRRAAWWFEAVRCLTWTKSSAAGPVLAGHANRLLRSRRRRIPAVVRLLEALRGHRCLEAETVLVQAVDSSEPAIRRAAFSSLGWEEPFDTWTVMRQLRAGRADTDTATRTAAIGALARIGERAAVREVSESLAAEEPTIRQAAALAAAEEGLTWLWPELETLAEAPDAETALVATESLERMREQILGPLG